MSDRLEIKISGANQSSAAFQQATRDITQLGTTAEATTQKMGRSFSDFNAKAAALGAGITSATLVLGEFTRAAAEDEAGQARLQQSIENTGASYDTYSEAVEQAIKVGQDKAFADDQVRDALVKLNLQTNDTQKSLDQMSLAMDFARAKGIGLSQAAEIIGKVYSGNLGILTRYGITLEENATAEDALAAIQQRSAGQAEAYEDSKLGWLDQQKIKWDELTESIGGSTGELQQFLMLMPGLTAGVTALSGLVSGMGGMGALAKWMGPVALGLGAGSLMYGYSEDSIGTTATNSFWNNLFLTGSGIMNTILPGNPYDQQRYRDLMTSNKVGDQLLALFGETNAVEYGNQIFGNPAFAAGEVFNYDADDLKDWIIAEAKRLNISTGALIESRAAASDLVQDPVSGQYYDARDYAVLFRDRTMAANGGTVYDPRAVNALINPGPRDSLNGRANPSADPTLGSYRTSGGTYAPREFGENAILTSGGPAASMASMQIDWQTQAAQAKAYTDALIAQYPAYQGVIEGMNSASDAAKAFKGTQDGILEQSSVFQQQQSEYSGVLSDMEAGYEILNQRKEDGIALSEEEIAFLESYDQNIGRVTGGIEDATVAQALLASQYAENMRIGDQMNATMEGTNDVVGRLADVLGLYILTLEGVPPEVRTELYLDNIEYALSSLSNFTAMLNGLPPEKRTTIYTTYIDYAPGSVEGGGLQSLHGGVVGYANGGVVARMAEAGPELLTFRNGGQAMALTDGLYSVPRGTYVTPAPASKGRGGAGGPVFQNCQFTVVANNPTEMYEAIRESAYGGSR